MDVDNYIAYLRLEAAGNTSDGTLFLGLFILQLDLEEPQVRVAFLQVWQKGHFVQEQLQLLFPVLPILVELAREGLETIAPAIDLVQFLFELVELFEASLEVPDLDHLVIARLFLDLQTEVLHLLITPHQLLHPFHLHHQTVLGFHLLAVATQVQHEVLRVTDGLQELLKGGL